MQPSQTYQKVSPAQMASLRTKLAAHGVTVPDGDSGTITGHTFFGSVTASFAYDSHLATLQVTVELTTGFISPSDVFAQIAANLN